MDELLESGRLAGVLCRLQRDAFSGLVLVDHEDRQVLFYLRDGAPVFVEEASVSESLAEAFIREELVTRDQYAEIVGKMTESLVESEDLAFCEHAVALGYLTERQVKTEIMGRVRGKLIQSVAWRDCYIELDDSPDALTGAGEYPQPLGPLVYMGVRTFYHEAEMRELVGDMTSQLYLRLGVSAQWATEFFGLEPEEEELLESFNSEVPIQSTIAASPMESLDAWQVVCLLILSGFAESSSEPFPSIPLSERSGVRFSGEASPGNRSVQGYRGVGREDRVFAPEQPHRPIPREDPDEAGGPGVREEHVFARGRSRVPPGSRSTRETMGRTGSDSAQQSDRSKVGSGQYHSAVSVSSSATDSGRAESSDPGERVIAPGQGHDPAGRENMREPTGRHDTREPTGRQTTHKREADRAQRPAASKASGGARKRAKFGALRSLDRELKQRRGPAAAPSGKKVVVEAGASHGKSHLKQLLKRRKMAERQAVMDSLNAAKLGGSFSDVQGKLRKEDYRGALGLLAKLREEEPENKVLHMYELYAAFRSGGMAEDERDILHGMLRECLTEEDTAGFALHALGHVAMASGKDLQAEKFFKKALAKDRNNKDAERHMRILEIRRESVKKNQPDKIFGIEMTFTRTKKDGD